MSDREPGWLQGANPHLQKAVAEHGEAKEMKAGVKIAGAIAVLFCLGVGAYIGAQYSINLAEVHQLALWAGMDVQQKIDAARRIADIFPEMLKLSGVDQIQFAMSDLVEQGKNAVWWKGAAVGGAVGGAFGAVGGWKIPLRIVGGVVKRTFGRATKEVDVGTQIGRRGF